MPGSAPRAIVRIGCCGCPGFTDATLPVCEARIGACVTGQTVTVASCIWPQCGQRIDRLIELVPDLLDRDVYVSGPESFVSRVVAMLSRLGVPKDSVHFEVYSL